MPAISPTDCHGARMTNNLALQRAITDLDLATTMTDAIRGHLAAREHEIARTLAARQRIKLKSAEVGALVAQSVELERIADSLALLALAR